MNVYLTGNWFTSQSDYYAGTYPVSGGTITVVWEDEAGVDVSKCTIQVAQDCVATLFPAQLLSELASSNRVERIYTAPFFYGAWPIYNGYLNFNVYYDGVLSTYLQYGSKNVYLFPDALGVSEVDMGITTQPGFPTIKGNKHINGISLSGVDYAGQLYERENGPFTLQYNYNADRTYIGLATVLGGLELTERVYTNSSGTEFIDFSAANILSIEFIDEWSYRYGDYRFYNMNPMTFNETRTIKVRVKSQNGLHVTGARVTGKLNTYNDGYELSKIGYTDYGTYTDVEFTVSCTTLQYKGTYLLVSYEDDKYLIKDRNTTANLGTIYPTNVLAFENITILADIPSDVEEETDYQITITYPTGNELTFAYPDGVNITLGEAVDNGNGTTTVTGTLRVDEEYEDDTADITISDGETSITKTISITEKEITMPNPTITFQRGFNLTFPQTGRTETITVVYEYTTEGRINNPYSSVWGVNITKGATVVEDNKITITYSISVPATTYAIDTIPLIFSCVGVNGSSCTETLYGNQEGTSTDNGDECYVKLDSYAYVFPSSGGTVYVNADFCKPVVGEGLKVRVMNSNGVYPISWCRAELKGGEIDEDGFEGHETWAIIMDGSDITEPFTALITFSYTNYYGESASATFTAIREAAAGEPESFDPEIQPYVTQLRFKADGSNDIQNMDYLHVMYQDFATGVINNPISDVGWFRIVETVKQEETEDGILMRYYYEVDVNELTVPRTGELKLSGVVAGVQYSTSVPLTQARAETTDDGGDDDGDDTGDIPIIEGTYIGQIWKDVEFDFGNQNPVSYSIWMGDEMIYSGKSYMRPGQGSNKILVNKIVQDYLVQPQLDLDAVSWYINGKEFTLRNADGSRISHTYRFINDWSYSDDFKTGNLSHPILNKQRAVRGQMYPFSIYGAGEQVSIEYGVTYMDGFVDEFGREIEDWWSTEYITNGVSTDFFKVARRDVEWIESVTVGDDTYYPEEPCAIPYVIYYVNPWGGFDWFPVTGKVTIKDSLTQYSYTKNYNNTKLGFGNSRYLTSIDRKYEVNTGWMTQAESERMWYLLESNVVYLHDIKADKIYPVLIKDTEVEHKKRSGSQKLISYTFTCQLSHNRKRQ